MLLFVVAFLTATDFLGTATFFVAAAAAAAGFLAGALLGEIPIFLTSVGGLTVFALAVGALGLAGARAGTLARGFLTGALAGGAFAFTFVIGSFLTRGFVF